MTPKEFTDEYGEQTVRLFASTDIDDVECRAMKGNLLVSDMRLIAVGLRVAKTLAEIALTPSIAATLSKNTKSSPPR